MKSTFHKEYNQSVDASSLRSAYVYAQMNLLEEMPKEALVEIIKELDRRLVQMEDKVKFERDNCLVDYGRLK